MKVSLSNCTLMYILCFCPRYVPFIIRHRVQSRVYQKFQSKTYIKQWSCVHLSNCNNIHGIKRPAYTNPRFAFIQKNC